MLSFLKRFNWDLMGMVTSIACAIHCAILPLVLTSLPLFGINIIHNPVFEWSMIGLAFAIGCYALAHGYKKHHRSPLPLLIFTGGFFFLILKQIFHSHEMIFLIPAVVLILYAHFLNLKYTAQCKLQHKN
ncbi:MAG TPA: MerC domain-containing protein [Chitinophagaceae bacterium]|nr:MerC domain-containing protein [Chitinophagaceae bacterium]